jgi:ubiquinone biosynthesis protein
MVSFWRGHSGSPECRPRLDWVSWILYLVCGAVAAVVVQRLLGVHFGLGRRLLVTVVSLTATVAIATQLGSLGTTDSALVVLVGSVLISAAAAVSLEGAGNRDPRNGRRWTLTALTLPSAIGQRLSRGRRYAQIVAIATRHGLRAYLRVRKPVGDLPRGCRLGQSLREALEEAGGMFVKFGQVLAVRADVLPAGVASQLRQLH